MRISPLVSVVIPAYNYARFVRQAIDCVLAQTYPNRECVVVDDGSTDETPRVLAEYGDRIRTIRQANAGLSAARNAGIAASRGELIAFLDADDWWHPEKLTQQVSFMEAHPEVGVVGCGLAVVEPDGSLRGEFVASRVSGDRQQNLRGLATRRAWVWGSGSGAMIRRSVFDRVGLFDTSLRAAEDWDLWMRVGAEYLIDNVPAVLLTLRQHGTGGFRNPRLMQDAQWTVYRKVTEAWPDVLTPAVRRQMRALIFADAGGEYLAGGNLTKAITLYGRSLAVWPFVRARWIKLAQILARAMLRRRRTAGATARLGSI